MSSRNSIKKFIHFGFAGSATLFLLSSCATFGGNVSGSFQCRAGEGICAPTTMIDDQALAMIAGETVDGYQTPAGPFETGREQAPINTAQTGGREIRIVFPSYVDKFGRTHEATAVRAYVRGNAFDGAALARGVNPDTASSLTMSGPGLDDIADRAPARRTVLAQKAAATNAQALNSSETPPEAKSDAVEGIKKEVAAKLSRTSSTINAGTFPAGVD